MKCPFDTGTIFRGTVKGNTYFNINAYGLGSWRILAGTNERFVTLGDGSGVTLPTPEIVSFTQVGDKLEMVWNEVPGAFYYKVYESFDPYGAYPDHYEVWDHNPGDGMVSYLIDPILGERFFKVYSLH